MSEIMTPRERWLAAMRMQKVDRLPFWPKLDNAYVAARADPFSTMSIADVHEWIGSDRLEWVGCCVKEVRSHTSVETTRENSRQRTVFTTPHGSTELIMEFDQPSYSWHPVKCPVSNLDQIRLMTDFYADTTVELDETALENTLKRTRTLGEQAFTATNVGTSALMHWMEFLAGIEMGHWLLCDQEAEVRELFDAYHRVLRRRMEVAVEKAPGDTLWLTENTSTTLISPEQYRTYCYPHMKEYATVTRDAGRLLTLHMCGHLKDLLPDLATVPADAFEAFTSPTLGNTTLLDGRSACPDKCLIGGTNAMLWTKPAKEIINQIRHDLDQLPHHRGIVVTSAGIMTPLCKPETIREVCEWVKAYSIRQ